MSYNIRFQIIKIVPFLHVTEENMVGVVLFFALVVLALASEGKKLRKYLDPFNIYFTAQ